MNIKNVPGQIAVPVNVEYASIEAVVVRCGCGEPLTHAEMQMPCPQARTIEDLGIVSEYRRPTWPMRLVARLKGNK